MQTNEEVVIIEVSEDKEPTIIQIMPALPGWEAVWGDTEEPTIGQTGYRTEAVVCWALVEDSDGRTYVTAMLPDLESSELKLPMEMGNFLGYATPSYSPDWVQMASDKRKGTLSNPA